MTNTVGPGKQATQIWVRFHQAKSKNIAINEDAPGP